MHPWGPWHPRAPIRWLRDQVEGLALPAPTHDPDAPGSWVVAQTPILDARERQSHDGYSDSARCEHLNAVPIVGLGPMSARSALRTN